MTVITSQSNPRIKYIMQLQKKAKTRNQQRVFVVEGPKMIKEAPVQWILEIYVSQSFLQKEEANLFLEKYNCQIVSDGVFSAMSDTKTPQGILALVQMPNYTIEDLLEREEDTKKVGKKKCFLVLEGIQDPGNLGTMVRTGEGAGITGVILDKNTVDLFHPKTIRSTMGSIYRVPFYVSDDLVETMKRMKETGVCIYAAHLKGKMSYHQPDYGKAIAFLIGNEGNGLSEIISSQADTYIRIPMEGQVESLNAAIAATLLMYEAKRQRDGGNLWEA